MADQNITALPKKTSSQMAATDYLLGIDSAEGYQMLIQDLGDYIIQHATSSLAGANQTLAAAVNALNSNTYSLTKGTGIPSGSDMNTYATPGMYAVASDTIAKNIQNCPVETAGTLVVEFPIRSNEYYTMQSYYTYDRKNRYVRMKNRESSWTTWELQPTRTEVDALDSNALKVKYTVYSFKPIRSLGAHTGTTFKILTGDNLSISIPDGYQLVMNTYIEVSGFAGLCVLYDGIPKLLSTTINPFIFNASEIELTTSANLAVVVVSLYKKS